MRFLYNRDVRYQLRFAFCLIGIVSTVAAQESAPAGTKLPPAMQAALNRIAKGEIPTAPVRNLTERLKAPLQGACSVPLQKMAIDNPGRFVIGRMLLSERHEPMPRVTVPAPPCD